MSLFKRLTHHELLKQYASVIEQILMSGSNMLASIVVLKVSDVAQFGIYSFIFVLSILIAGLFGTLLHRQMMLEIASEDESTQRQIFLATIAIELVGLIALIFILLVFWNILSVWLDVASYRHIALAGGIYIVLLIVFDAFKQYSYTTGNQIYSLRSTSIYVFVQLLLMGFILIFVDGSYAVEAIYMALAVSLLVSLLANRLCQKSLIEARWLHWLFVWQVLAGYFKQGRFSLLGMSITWAQNQSMNPFLMVISGPTVAGYFSLGRLLIMPMAVVSQGLVNSSTPTLRRLYKQSGSKLLVKRINSFLIKTSTFSIFYLVLLIAAHFSGLLHRYVPDYEQVQWYLLLWVALSSCSIARFWKGQFFVVSMNFKFLLRTSIVALSVTISGMLIFGVGLDSIRLALLSVIAGEIVALALYRRNQAIELNKT